MQPNGGQHAEPQRGFAPHGSDPWWIALGSEEVVLAETCPGTSCRAPLSPVDIFCPDVAHGDLLLFQHEPTGRARWWIVNTLRTIVVALVVLAAAHDTPWPIYLLAVAIGFGRIGAALHAHRRARTVGLLSWAAVSAVTAIVAASHLHDEMRLVWTAGAALPLAVIVFFGVQGTIALTDDEPHGVEREAARAVAGSLTLALALLAAWWLTTGSLHGRFVDLPGTVTRWLGFAGLGSALGVVLIAAVGALVMSFGQLDLAVDDVFPTLPARRSVRRFTTTKHEPRPTGRSGLGAQLQQQVRQLLAQLSYQLRRSTKALLRQVANTLLAFVCAAQRAGCRLVNWINRRLRLIGRRVRFVAGRGLELCGLGATYTLWALGAAARPMLAFAGSIGGSIAALLLAEAFTEYLVDGPLARLAAGFGWSCLGLAACFLVWAALASVGATQAISTELRFLNRVTPDVALFTIVAGWVVGIPGSLGYGPIRVGWVTVVGTVVLVALLGNESVAARRQGRGLDEVPAEGVA